MEDSLFRHVLSALSLVYLIHGVEVEPQVCEEGEGELEAGVEKQVEEVGPADRPQPAHVGRADVLQRCELRNNKKL